MDYNLSLETKYSHNASRLTSGNPFSIEFNIFFWSSHQGTQNKGERV